MKLRNKKTGEIVEFEDRNFISSKDYGFIVYANGGGADDKGISYNSLAELCEEWTDYEEPKGFWLIDVFGVAEYQKTCDIGQAKIEHLKSIGNYFETKEEAEEAVRKLQAWKRLKDNGVKFDGWERYGDLIEIRLLDLGGDIQIDDLTLLFGGEE